MTISPSRTVRRPAPLRAALRSSGAPVDRRTSTRLDLARIAVLGLMRGIRGGTVELTMPGEPPSGSRRYGSGGPAVAVRIHDDRAFGAIARHGSIGLGRSYAAGWWDADDLTVLLRILHRSLKGTHALRNLIGSGSALVRDGFAVSAWHPDLKRDRANISAHYDLGNQMFAAILDPSMMYSSAVFEPSDISLASAQQEKVRRLAAMSGVRPGEEVLEIGTGWGAFAQALAEDWSARVVTTTIGAEQYAYARDRMRREGLEDRVTVLDRDYRQLASSYDRIFAVEMIEAVDWREHDVFFAACARMLRPHGSLTMQAIVIDDRAFDRTKYGTDFIKSEIFPGGCLPSVSALQEAARRSDLRLAEVHHHGQSYARTLAAWRDNLTAAPDIDPEFRRLWHFYLSYCEAGFAEGYLDVVQVRFEHA